MGDFPKTVGGMFAFCFTPLKWVYYLRLNLISAIFYSMGIGRISGKFSAKHLLFSFRLESRNLIAGIFLISAYFSNSRVFHVQTILATHFN
jgi:hypothetical protein